MRRFSHMTSTLSTVVIENAEVFAKILRNCGLPQVADWKLEDVKRAFNWAQYFQKVNQRIGSRTSVLNKLESRVKEIGWSLGVRFGQEELSFHFLVHNSLQYCIQVLLGNPLLPDQLRQHILSNHSDLLDDPHDAESKPDQALLTVLAKVHANLKASIPNDDPTLSLCSLDAAYLREDITWLLEATDNGTYRSESAEHAISTAETRLISLAQIDSGMEVILLALLQSSAGSALAVGPCQLSRLDSSRKFILEWLVKVAQAWNEGERRKTSESAQEHCSTGSATSSSELGSVLWSSAHGSLLVRISITYFSFFKEHLKCLVCKTGKLNFQMSPRCMCLKKEQQKCEDSLKQVESLKKVASQWAALVCGGSHVREVCLPVIKSRAFPHLVFDETLTAKNKLHMELCHAGHSLDYPPTENNAWTEVLKAVELAIKEHH